MDEYKWLLNKIANRILGFTNMVVIYQTAVGLKCFNHPIVSQNLDNFRVKDLGCVSTDKLYICLDRLKDKFTLTGLRITDSPYYSLMGTLNDKKSINDTEYIHRLRDGLLDYRQPVVINSKITGYIREKFIETEEKIKTRSFPSIKVINISGNYYIADGKHRSALCALHNIQPYCVDVSPIIFDKFFKRVYCIMKKYHKEYLKHLALFEEAYKNSR